MPVNHPLAARYREVAIKTANPLQLIVILYDAAIQSLQEAQQYLKTNDIANRAHRINRALAIITELQAVLNFKDGSDIAVSLDRLYRYMKDRIFKGNIEQNTEPLAEVVRLLENLRSAWVELSNQAKKTEPPALNPPMPEIGILNPRATGSTDTESLNISA